MAGKFEQALEMTISRFMREFHSAAAQGPASPALRRRGELCGLENARGLKSSAALKRMRDMAKAEAELARRSFDEREAYHVGRAEVLETLSRVTEVSESAA